MLRHAIMPCCVLMTAVAGGCNPFIQHYSGEIHPRTMETRVVEVAPNATELIGRSVFETSETCTETQALEAARKVGAEFLVYEEVDLGEHRSWEQTTLMTRSGPAGGLAPINLPVSVTRQWHEYRASFYRTRDSGPVDEGTRQKAPNR